MADFTSNNNQPAVTATNNAIGPAIKAISDSFIAVEAVVNRAGAIGLSVQGGDGTIAILATASDGGQAAIFSAQGPGIAAVECQGGLKASSGSFDAGVFAESDSGDGLLAKSNSGNGVRAESESGDGLVAGTKGLNKSAVFAFNTGQGDAPTGGSPGGNGVFGLTGVNGGAGVFGANNGTKGRGVQGDGPEVGVGGFSAAGNGVLAQSTTGIAILAQGPRAGRFEGNVEVTGNIVVDKDVAVSGDIRLPQRDIAELFPACPDAQLLPGSVMVIDPEGMLTASTEAYDTRAVGIVSSGGDLRPAMILGAGHPEGTASIAMVGTTYCQADASDAPILPGDLLVSGQRKGHAMKALDSFRRIGAIIGKSLERLDSGQGLVRVVVTLQ
jgi:hypothetical protein